ncbi:DUF4476 domain-containing protein [Pedobacter nototheniae]|uniref:DUF4476 domain-containing protein n=1 Tax=Pedobacter nototheniae TaxID=2488994 RepID=UPI00103DAEA0|nr:DUF4476 domain-containing protein [Pedobacter nototheniae]
MKKIILLGLALISFNFAFAQGNQRKSEVFVQIEEPGNYTVYLDNEFVGSANGRFRFYDVYNSAPTLSIIQGNITLYKRKLSTNPNQRLVLSYSKRSGLIISKELNIYRNRQYALNDFDDYTDSYNTGIVPPIISLPDRNYRLLSAEAFQQFYDQYKKESFDDGRTKMINAVSRNASLSSAQIRTLLKPYTFDQKRLDMAKSLYKDVADPQNYFTLSDVFEFFNYKDSFLEFLGKQ